MVYVCINVWTDVVYSIATDYRNVGWLDAWMTLMSHLNHTAIVREYTRFPTQGVVTRLLKLRHTGARALKNLEAHGTSAGFS